MTVATLVSTVSYTSDGISTIYPYPFYLIDAAHMQVWVNGALLPVNLYTVTSVGNQFGGEVRLNVAPAAGLNITLRRHVPATQLVDYRPYDPFPAEVHEQALDKLTMIVQEQDGFIANAIRAPLLEPVGAFNLVLPIASVRANFTLGFDAAGNIQLYPNYGPPPSGITDHGALTGLADDDHPQYMLRSDLAGSFLPLAGGTMTGAIQLPPGFPASATEAVNKAYVDTFVGSVITKNIISNATGDAQGTVQGAWNAQANAVGITRASNEIIYYRWKSTDTVVYRYVGSHQGPAGWATVATDWAAASGVNEAPLDGFIYGRKAGAWAKTIELTGGAFLGKVQGFAGAAAAADLARTDEAMALDTAALAAHVALLDPHTQYVKKSGFTSPGLFPDGTLALPGIAWANEPSMGFLRNGAGNTLLAVAGVAVMNWSATGIATGGGITVSLSGPLNVSGAVTINAGWLQVIGQQVNANGFIAVAGNSALTYPATISGALYNQGIVVSGTSADYPPSFNIHWRHGNGTISAVPIYKWGHSNAGLGTHTFSLLSSTHPSQQGIDYRIVGPILNGSANLGLSLLAVLNNNAFGVAEWQVLDPTAGSYISTWKVSIAKRGSLTAAGDIALRYAATYGTAGLFITSGMTATLSNINQTGLVIEGQAGLPVANVTLSSFGEPRWIWISTGGGNLYWGPEGGGGAVGGWAMNCNYLGDMACKTMAQLSDASGKKNVRPLGSSLATLLRLKPVRYVSLTDDKEDLGFVAQEVEPIYPEAIHKVYIPQDGGSELLAINYSALIAPIIEAIRELNARLTAGGL